MALSLPKVLNQGEDAPVNNVTTFAPDEHLRQVLRTAEPQVVEVPGLPAFLDRRRPQ
jgi:hypothetical protein